MISRTEFTKKCTLLFIQKKEDPVFELYAHKTSLEKFNKHLGAWMAVREEPRLGAWGRVWVAPCSLLPFQNGNSVNFTVLLACSCGTEKHAGKQQHSPCGRLYVGDHVRDGKQGAPTRGHPGDPQWGHTTMHLSNLPAPQLVPHDTSRAEVSGRQCIMRNGQHRGVEGGWDPQPSHGFNSSAHSQRPLPVTLPHDKADPVPPVLQP